MGNSPVDVLSPIFEEVWGYEANGHAWQALLQTLVQTHHPEIAPLLSYDSEADMFCVRSSDAEQLKHVAQLVRMLLEDQKMLRTILLSREPD